MKAQRTVVEDVLHPFQCEGVELLPSRVKEQVDAVKDFYMGYIRMIFFMVFVLQRRLGAKGIVVRQ